VTYFIQFTKYQNRICWDNHSLRKVVKDTISTRISEELYSSKEDLSTFEGYKQAVLKIDNDHWQWVQEEKNRQQLACTLQGHLYRTPWPKPPRNGPNNKPLVPDRQLRDWTRLPNLYNSSQPPIVPPAIPTNVLGPDSRLTTVEWQWRMSLGLCMCCGQSGHLARNCLRQSKRPLPTVEAQATLVEDLLTSSKLSKKALANILFLRELSTWDLPQSPSCAWMQLLLVIVRLYWYWSIQTWSQGHSLAWLTRAPQTYSSILCLLWKTSWYIKASNPTLFL